MAVLVVLQVIIWKETNGNWNKLYEFCEHKSSGSFSYMFYITYAPYMYIGMTTLPCGHITTVDWEIFALKIICVEKFHVDKFLQFV